MAFGRRRGKRKPTSSYVIITPESNSSIRVPSITTPEQAERAIAELLGPVYEDRTDLPPGKRIRKH